MKHETFDKMVTKTLNAAEDTLINKAKEYAKGGDRLHNFKVAARIGDETPLQALEGMMRKHYVSFLDLVDDPSTASIELIDEKTGDLINYILLAKACMLEEKGEQEQLLEKLREAAREFSKDLEEKREETREFLRAVPGKSLEPKKIKKKKKKLKKVPETLEGAEYVGKLPSKCIRSVILTGVEKAVLCLLENDIHIVQEGKENKVLPHPYSTTEIGEVCINPGFFFSYLIHKNHPHMTLARRNDEWVFEKTYKVPPNVPVEGGKE